MSKNPTAAAVLDTDITVLYEPKNGIDCVADIVFVHGLQGHPRRTWTYSTASPKRSLKSFFKAASFTSQKNKSTTTHEDVFWPADSELLPRDCPSARIMTWGYASAVSNFFGGATNQNSFYDHANDLLYALDRKRMQDRDRPLIFVMHSLGGIIVKQALLYSYQAEGIPEHKSIESSTVALIFLGTPHRGSSFAHWGQLAKRIMTAAFFDVNSKNVGALQPHGESLSQLEKSFGSLIIHDHFTIHTFQEALGYKGVKGLNGRVVEPWSASVGQPGKERIETINANHMDLCRYEDEKDEGYIKVGSAIKSYVEELREKLATKLAKEYADYLASLSEGVSMGVSGHVTEPQEGTCQWIFEDVNWVTWLQDRHGVFAIKGKAGSGKSTIMKYLYEKVLARSRSLPKRTMKIGFFFNQGLSSNSSFSGLLRGLLHQIFNLSKELYRSALPDLRMEVKRTPDGTISSNIWNLRFLQTILMSLFRHAGPYRILAFVDALDECLEADRAFVIQFLNRWFKAARKSDWTLDICISSRPETDIDMDLAEVLNGSILLQNENHRDIRVYVEEQLASRHGVMADYRADFAAKVADRADGVFLWVILVVPLLRKAIAAGHIKSELEELLERTPQELKEVYRDILGRIDKELLQDTMRMLQVVILTERSLTLDEFRHAIAFGPDSEFTSLADWRNSSKFIEDGVRLTSRIQSRSGGLLEVCYAPRDPDEYFDHKVQDFRDHHERYEILSRQKSLGLLPSLDHTPQGDLNYEASRNEGLPLNVTAQTRRRRQEVTASATGTSQSKSTKKRQSRSAKASTPIASSGYRWNNSQYTRSSLERSLAPDDESLPSSRKVVRLIHATARTFFVKGDGFNIIWDLIQEFQVTAIGFNPFTSLSGCYLTGGHDYIIHCCFSYLRLTELRAWINKTQLSDARSVPGEFPFARYVVESWPFHVGRADNDGIPQNWLMEYLLAHTNLSNDLYVYWAAKHNISSWIDVAAELEFDVDTPEMRYGLPIRTAVEKGHLEMVERLVQAGANVNGVTGGSETTLLLANRQNNQDMIKLLLRLGAAMAQPHWLPPQGIKVCV